jgi:type IV secretory pathway VirB3-like protein
MRAERLLSSIEDALATPPGRGLTRSSGSGVRWRLLVIVAGALAFLVLWGSAPTVLLCLILLHWISEIRAVDLQPGITSRVLVPG